MTIIDKMKKEEIIQSLAKKDLANVVYQNIVYNQTKNKIQVIDNVKENNHIYNSNNAKISNVNQMIKKKNGKKEIFIFDYRKKIEKQTKKELIEKVQKIPKKNIIAFLIKQSGGEYEENSQIKQNIIKFNQTKETNKNQSNILHNNDIYNNV